MAPLCLTNEELKRLFFTCVMSGTIVCASTFAHGTFFSKVSSRAGLYQIEDDDELAALLVEKRLLFCFVKILIH